MFTSGAYIGFDFIFIHSLITYIHCIYRYSPLPVPRGAYAGTLQRYTRCWNSPTVRVGLLVRPGGEFLNLALTSRGYVLSAIQICTTLIYIYMLDRCASIDASDDRQWTALHYTARLGYIEVVKRLGAARQGCIN